MGLCVAIINAGLFAVDIIRCEILLIEFAYIIRGVKYA